MKSGSLRAGLVFAVAVAASTALAGRAAADATLTSPARHKFDLRDLAMMSDATRAVFERGESLLLAGDLAAALPLIEQVTSEAQHSAIAYRYLVEIHTAMGHRDDAITTCYATLRRRNSAMDFRACVGAFVSGTQPISPNDMYQAVTFARHAIEASPDLPFGYAAQCDIANRIGDVEMLNECTKQLERIAPNHAETRRAHAFVSAATHPFRVAAAWIALAFVGVGTLVHAALRGREGRPARTGAIALGSGLLCLLLAFPQPAHADNMPEPPAAPAASAGGPDDHPVPGKFSKFPIDDKDPLSSVPSKAELDAKPLDFGYLIMDLTERASHAAAKGDHQAALRYWQALAKATPDRGYAFAKLCETYETLGRWNAAVYSCSAVLERTGTTLKDYARYVGIVLSKKSDLTSAELAALDTVLAHLAQDEKGKGAVDELSCRIGVRTWDAKRLASCSAAITTHAPNHPNSIFFQWALAVARGEAEEARQLIGRASEVNVKAEELAFMEKETSKLAGRWKNYLGMGAGFAVVLVSGLGLLYLYIRRQTAKAPGDTAPSGAAA